MLESSTPLLVGPDVIGAPGGYRNVTDLLARRAEIAPDHAAFEVPSDPTDPNAPWRDVSTREFTETVRAVAKGLLAIGVRPGDAIAIMAPTRYEWAVADLAVWFAGGVVVPIYETSAPTQVSAIIHDAKVVLAVGGSAHHVGLLTTPLDARGSDALGVWSMDAADGPGEHRDLDRLAALGLGVADEALEERRLLATADSPATIVYTSGTTGEPKGAVLTHENFLGQVLNIAAAYGEVVHPAGNTIIFLPLAHVLARGLQLICLASGMRIAHLADPTAVVGTLGQLKPTFLVVVPRVLQKIQAAAGAKAAASGLAKVWGSAQSTAVEWSEFRETATPAARAPLGLRIRHGLFDAVFYRRLRQVMGGRVTHILSGGATLDAELSLFFGGIGVPVIEGYGLTETTAPLTGNLPSDIRSGTVGRPLPGSTVRISDDGEILARGIGVFSGYRNPEHNQDAFVDGFFRTGDLGRLDEQGRVVLEGRLKDVIVTSNGKTIVPMRWESSVESDSLVSHAVMIGEGRNYLSALIILDPLALAEFSAEVAASAHPRPEQHELLTVVDAKAREHVQRAVDRANELVARSEQVRRFTLIATDLDDPTFVTPTLKLKRAAVLQRSTDVVDALYSS
ncbi:AMP-dependent synthetase/ligase [Pseudoclavibacter sp. VKM Ac-2867]|uniref:AMP-dependent synthetase/ligase n=1 Tax=Pseudoclavibacter sp. VKM Ac-2867 TaxID=2783829 RepID=UPI00188B1248|nr:AMP-dependent synthetase/ligase [Pseudoclavibacter sp. VKM Ac-2867]MBF4459058.1 long-chain fatty acid--CoA ligase [Pseudoclavibacter sp. VKM Ac-2867]